MLLIELPVVATVAFREEVESRCHEIRTCGRVINQQGLLRHTLDMAGHELRKIEL